ncbi:MAG: hypothetical protein IKN17_07825 [Ruminococcus sp.]|nr:hypothetical protein [Ruminococcus sp.]
MSGGTARNTARKKPKYRLGLLIIASLIVLGVTFAAYMINTTLEDTLISERGKSVVTHNYDYDSQAG